MELTDLRPNEGATRKRKIVGRGRASGHGKTSTRGHNGQGQRSGESKRFGFEGGQTPLFRRLPKLHNFDQVINREWVEVNVGALNNLPAGTEVDGDSLVHHKLLRKATDSLRILGNGDLKVALKVLCHHVSAGAKAKIEAAGGSVEVVEVKVKEGKRTKRFNKAVAAYEERRNSPLPSIAANAIRAEEKAAAKVKAAQPKAAKVAKAPPKDIPGKKPGKKK
jgi:large subunit ribosomal protein L15